MLGVALSALLFFDAQVREAARSYHYAVEEVRFPTALRSKVEADNTVWGRLYLPTPRGRRPPPPCVLVLPVMAAPNAWIEERFVQALVSDHYAVFLLEMPFQGHRRAYALSPSGQGFLSRTAKGLARNFRQSVLDGHRAVTWLQRSGLVDARRVAVLGVSLGGMVGSTLLSLDDRLQGGVFLLAGADFPDLVVNSSMTGDFIRKAGISREEIARAWRGLDPLEYTRGNRNKKVVLVNARADTVIPRACALKLRDAFPASRQAWVPLGHYTSLLHMVWMPAYASWRMRGILGPA